MPYGIGQGESVIGDWSFGTPMTDLFRMAMATATSMSLFQGNSPSANCSYQLDFYGPALSCNPGSVSTLNNFNAPVEALGEVYST